MFVQRVLEPGREMDLGGLDRREAMEERLGVVVTSVDQLAEKLSAYIAGEENIEGVQQGRVENSNGGMTTVGRDDDLHELLDLWIRGLNFDWNRLYGDVKPRRIPLPTYPFARERYWIQDVDGNMKSIEDIINQVDEDTIETEHAIQALKMFV